MAEEVWAELDFSRRSRLAKRLRYLVSVTMLAIPALTILGISGARRCFEQPEIVSPVELVALAQPEIGSAVVLARSGTKDLALVADADRSEILSFDLESQEVVARTPVPGTPTALLLATDGTLYVTRRDAAKVGVFRAGPKAGSLVPVAELSTEAEPVAMALDASGDKLVVVSGWGHALEVFSTARRARILHASLEREPRAVAVDRSGHAVVAHAVGSRLSVVDLESGKVADLRLEGGARATRPAFDFVLDAKPEAPRPRSIDQGFSIARLDIDASERFFVPGAVVDSGDPIRSPVQSHYGGVQQERAMEANVAILDAKGGLVPSSLGSAPRETANGCILPRAAAVDRFSRSLFVACLGSDEVVEYDARENPVDGLKRRWPVASGPIGMAIWRAKQRLVVWSSFDRVLTLIDRKKPDSYVEMASEPPREPTLFEVGRKLFHRTDDSRISSDGRACASCHPDGRQDGLTWSGPEGARQTPMLAGKLGDSAPYGWSGASATVSDHVGETMKRLGGRGLDDRGREALVAYLDEMKPPPIADRSKDDAVARGREVFASAETGCASCHQPGAGFTDGQSHDVGSLSKADRVAKLDTPSLRFLSGTAPYFHDGRYATLGDLLEATDGTMGTTGHLSPSDRGALVAYLESL